MSMRVALTLLLAMLITGCATTRLPPAPPGPAQTAINQDYYQVRITTHDGKRLAATVYQPALAPGQSAPLVIATHGFGGFRAKRPLSIYGQTMITGEAALAAWRKGYWVVFYDQRGWGGSQGVVNMMDPEYEIKDVSTVIDWALKHLPAIHTLDDGSPAIGMIGESYGGGAQTMASFVEPRLKALVPIATWHDLNALAPNRHMKTNWGAILLIPGGISSGFDIGFMMKPPLRSGFTGTMSFEGASLMYERSPAHFCDMGIKPQADALFVQGFRDNLFPMQEALNNQRCFSDAGRDARLVAIQGGHILPWPVQKWSGKPLFNTEDRIRCGQYEATLVDTIVGWWDEKLRDEDRIVPNLCMTLDYKHEGLGDDSFPLVKEVFPVPPNRVHIPFAGIGEWLGVPSDNIGDLFRGMWPGADLRFLKPRGGIVRPRFIPVHIAGENEALAGIPEINLNVAGTASRFSTRVFVGVGVQHAGKWRVRVASEQLTPLPRKGNFQQELPAVTQPLKPGDRVGLVVYGYSWQYFFNPSYWWSRAQVSGEVALPIMELEPARRR
jgi:ABC-2 type transport system ATP-binding protein